MIGSAATDIAKYHGQPGFLAQTIALAQRFGIAHELLDAAAIRERFPAFLVADGERGYLEHDAGVLFPERIVAAQLAQAGRHGANLRLEERVLSIEPAASGVEVVTDRGRLSAARVIVTAGAWAPGLAGTAFGTRLRVLRQVLDWFGVDDPALDAPERCPVFIWLHGRGGQRASMYGFPMVDGIAGPKVASEQDTTESDPDRVDRRSRRTMRSRSTTTMPAAECAASPPACCAPPPASTPARPMPRSWCGRIPSPRRSPSSRPARATASSIRRRSAKPWRTVCWAGRPGLLDTFTLPR